MSELKLPRLLAAAKEFNVGQDTLIDFLAKKGFNKDELKPTAKLTEEMYYALKTELQNDMSGKSKLDFVEVPNRNQIGLIKNTDSLSYAIIEGYNRYYKKQLAGENIEKCLESKSTRLDLGNCGLTDDDFAEGGQLDTILRDCIHIEDLILSNEYCLTDTYVVSKSNNNGKPNRLYKIPHFVQYLTKLKSFICAGDTNRHWGIKDISTLERLEELVYLDLSFNAISEMILLKSSSLHTLILRRNRIVETINFDTFLELEELILSGNQIASINQLNSIASLRTLYLGSNKLEKENINLQLPQLIFLNLSGNEISGTLFLKGCYNLSWLDISKNKFSDEKQLFLPPSLRTLNLSENEYKYLGNFDYLPNIVELDVSYNKIKELNGIERFQSLQRLSLKGNQVNNVEYIGNLIYIDLIDLSFNEISNLDGLQNLNKLTTLVLTDNLISEVSPIFNLKNLSDVDLTGNPILEGIPEEEIRVGWKAIKSILQETNFVVLPDVKLLLLGSPNVGKSNLLEYLTTSREPNLNTSTYGIQYKVLDKVIGDTKIHCWDFGGQEYFHATHQLFFSQGALHIILWSKKDEDRVTGIKEACFELPYWLRCVENLINDNSNHKTEVIVAENKIDNNNNVATALDQKQYEIQFPNLNLHFTSLGLKPLARIEGFKELVKERVETLIRKRPISYRYYLRQIETKSVGKSYLEVNDIYISHRLGLKAALEVFHLMGLLLYYPNIFPEKVFTNPQSLLDLIYVNILKDKSKFRLNKKEITKSIEGHPLNLKIEEVIKLLEHYKLVFKIPELPDEYFIPQYLSAPPTLMDFLEQHHFQDSNIKICADNFLMNLAMLDVFSKYGKYVKGKESQEFLFWKDGIVIDKDGVLLLIKFNREEQTIKLYPDVKNENFDLQKELVGFILDCAKSENANSKEPLTREECHDRTWVNDYFSVWVSLDGIFFTKWKDLHDKRKNGILQVEALGYTKVGKKQMKTLSVFDYNKYLPVNQRGKMKKIFISYSKEDLKLVDKFIDHLAALKLDGKVEEWYCTELSAGSDWHHEIQAQFDASDIVCFMVSPNFMKTKYIHEHEIKRAFERIEKDDNFKIVPIVLDFCRWTSDNENRNLGKYTALPYTAKPVVDFINQNMAWYTIEESLRFMIDSELSGDKIEITKEIKKIYERIVDGKFDNNS